MRKTLSIYKDDSTFDFLQKTIIDGNNNKKNDANDNFDTYLDIESSKISEANYYLSGLVNEMKETILDDFNNIFIEPKKKQSIETSNNKLKPQNTFSRKLTMLSNKSGKSKKSRKTYNPKSNRSNKGNNSSRSNKKDNNAPLTNRSGKNKKNNNLLHINYENKGLKRNLTIAKDILLKKEKEKFNKMNENNDNQNDNLSQSQIGYRHLNSINVLTKKSSFKPKEIRRFSCYMNNQNSNFLQNRTTTLNRKNTKSVKFDLPTRTNTLLNKPKRNFNNPVRRWSEVKDRRKSNKENSLFSFFQRPEYFEEDQKKTDISNKMININDNNEELYKVSQLSNKNILELNKIARNVRKSILLTNNKNLTNFKLSDLDKKKYLYDNEDSKSESSENEVDKEKKKEEEEKTKREKEKYRELQRTTIVYDSLDEYNDEDISTFFIHPESKFLRVLDCIVAISVFYNLIYIPLFLGSNEIYCRIGSFYTFTNIIELIIDFICVIDFFIHFFVGFYNEEDILQTDLLSIIINNLKGWFFIDLLSAIPFKTIFSFYDTKCKDISFLSSYKYQNQFHYLLICLRLLKTFRLHKNKFLQYCDEVLDKYVHYNNYFSFYLDFYIFCITIHLVTCILIFIGRNDYPSWIIHFNFTEYNFGKLYFIGIYYIITTVTTVGYGDLTCVTPKEKIFGILVEIVGIFGYSWVVSSISNYVKSKSDAEDEYFKKYQILEKIKMTYKDLSDDLFERIVRYLKNKQINEEQEKNLIDELPISLKNTLVYNMYEPIIQNFIFFKNFDNKDFIVKVIFCFKPILAIRNDVLIKDGDFIEDIIFVKKGRLSLELPIKINQNQGYESQRNINNNLGLNSYSTQANTTQNLNIMKTTSTKVPYNNIGTNFTEDYDEEEIEEYQNFKILDIRKNEHFGDVLMLSHERSPLMAIVKSRKAEMFYLNKKDALEISQNFPQIWSKIQKKSIFNMKQIKRLMAKVMKIFYNSNGISSRKNDDDDESNDEDSNDYELQPIPTMSEFNETVNNHKHGNSKVFSSKIQNLKTIEEGTIIEDSENENSNSNSNSKSIVNSVFINSEVSGQDLEYAATKKFESGSEYSSNFKKSNRTNNKDNMTIKMEHLSNRNIEFSDILTNNDNINSIRSDLTPYKPEEINKEIYPNENQNFMKFNIFHDTNFNSDDNIQNKNLGYNKRDKIISINYNIQNNTILNNNNSNNNNNNNNNISICSTEISFSISSKYENIDELSDYRYSKTPKLRKKIKSILKELDFENEFVKYQTNKSTKKTEISINSTHNQIAKKNSVIKKKYSAELKKKKMKNQEERKKSSDNIISFASLKNPKFNFLDLINGKNNQENNNNGINIHEPPTSTQLIENFINNSNYVKNKEIQEHKDELNKKIQNIRSMKDQSKILFKSKVDSI